MLEEKSVDYVCTRCGARFGGVFRDKVLATRHADSDAEHVSYEKTGHVRRSPVGVLFYPLSFVGRIMGNGSFFDSDEGFLWKPVYEIFIRDVDGKRRVLQTVKGSCKVEDACRKHWERLYKQEGRVTRRRILGLLPVDEYDF